MSAEPIESLIKKLSPLMEENSEIFRELAVFFGGTSKIQTDRGELSKFLGRKRLYQVLRFTGESYKDCVYQLVDDHPESMEALGMLRYYTSPGKKIDWEQIEHAEIALGKELTTNAYGWTKLMMEQVFKDVQKADPEWNVILLRYFNPIGAHKSGLIGEDPAGIPNNLLPYVAQVAVGRRAELNVFGNDYPTPDGTGIRDYIHVVDLAIGHLKAIEKLEKNPQLGLKIYNLGTGNGYSVLQVVKAFEKASKRPVPYKICPRRPGDIAECWADPSLAAKELGWKAERGIDEMCADAWRWQKKNPYGYNKNV